ncbi:MAG: hypothetical protein JNL91_08075, partial [Candidatus Accumulibacter sp.]|nr:hypothetical protein [Accumulibacter sp.]
AGLESVQLRIGYDATRFDLVAVRRGSITGDFGWFITGNEPGRITVDMSRLEALQGGAGTLLDIDLRIRADALPGVTPIDLQYASLNDGRLTLNVLPQVGADASDGRITIAGKAAGTPVGAPVAATTPLATPFATGASDALPQAQPAALEGGWYPVPVPGNTTAAAPVIDLAASFSLPPAISEAIVADGKRKPWLKDYLGNVGQASKASPNAGLKVIVPVSPVVSSAGRVALV